MSQAQNVPAAAAFAPGSRIEARDEEWIVRSVQDVGEGNQALRVVGASELVRGWEAIFLTDLESPRALRVEETELVPDPTQGHQRTRLYIESLLRRSPPTDTALHIGHKAAMRPNPFQLRPAEDALNALRPRILIADAVGLGKTLEVGVLLSELIRRGRGERILVVVMKSMLAQFQRELWTRFTIPLVRLDSDGLKRVRQKIPAGKNPFHYFKRAIISVDTLKNQRQYRHWLEQCRWDAVCIDECHNVMNAGTGRHRVATQLASTSEALILTSATPHNGKPESFANLINMLDPTAIADPLSYEKKDIKGLYRRRFKKDVEHEVAESFPERATKSLVAGATAAEDEVFTALHEARFHTLNRRVTLASKGRPRDVLFRTTLLKSFLSSPWALIETCEARIKSLNRSIEKAEEAGHSTQELSEDLVTISSIRDQTLAISSEDISKLNRLLDDALPELGVTGKKDSPRVVIFSERIATLNALADAIRTKLKLKQEKGELHEQSVVVLTGGEADHRIRKVQEAFGAKDGRVRILLASDVLSEGINLHHFCSRLVHYDVPWSMIRLEQRNGRIDRYGQREEPQIRFLLTQAKDDRVRSDQHVIETLIRKEEAAQKNLGDAGSVMALWEENLEEDFVAATISENKDLDEAIPELIAEQKASTSGPNPGEAAENDTDDGVDLGFFQDFFASDDDHNVAQNEPAPETAVPTTLFDDDLKWFLAGLEEIAPRVAEEGHNLEVQRHPERPELQFAVPPDLRRRFADLPPKARPRDGRLELSTDREAVQDAIFESLDEEGKWPDLQLLWPLHPVMDWMTDRLLVTFGRQQAPLVVAPGLRGSGHDAIALMEGTVSNELGRPVITEWFGLPTTWSPRATVGAPIGLDAFITRTGLQQPLPNIGVDGVDLERLANTRREWEAAGTQWMAEKRFDRGAALSERLKDGMRRAKAWEDSSMARIEIQKTHLAQKLGRRAAKALKKLEEEQQRVSAYREKRNAWLKKEFTTDKRPYLRLIAVFVPPAGDN